MRKFSAHTHTQAMVYMAIYHLLTKSGVREKSDVGGKEGA